MIPMCTFKVGPQHGSKYFTGINTKILLKTFSYKQFDQKQARCIFNVQFSGSVHSS